MKVTTLLGLFVLVLAISVGTYFALRTPPSGEPDGVAAIEEVDPGDNAPTKDALQDPGTEPSDLKQVGAPTRTPLLADELPEWTRKDATHQRTGRILLPPGTPDDEELIVTVTPSQHAPGRTWEPYDVGVDADGGFEYIEPNDAGRCELSLGARYLITDGPLIAERLGQDVAEPTLQPRLGAWITGEITLPEGAEVSAEEWQTGEAKVGLDFEAGVDRTAAVAAEAFARRNPLQEPGRFDFFGMPPTSGFGLEVDLEAYPHKMIGSLAVRAGEHLVIDIVFDQGVTLLGHVVDESGGAMPDARIVATPGEATDIFARRMTREATTGEDGTFSISGLPAGLLRVEVSKDGYLPPSAERVVLAEGASSEDIELVLASGASVSGVVFLPDGEPAVRAEVELSFDPAALNGLNAMNRDRGATGEVLTDTEGKFLITGLASGPFFVEAEITGAPWLYDSHAGVKPGMTDIELHLHELLPLRGRVIDAAEDPITEYQLDLRAGSLGGLISGEGAVHEISDPDGRFAIEGVKDGSWNVYIRSEGFGAAGPFEADRPGSGNEELLITLVRGATVRGQVVTPNSDPVPGAIVTWTQDSRDTILNLIGAGPSISGTTDEEGIFELVGLPAGDIALETAATEWAKAEPTQLTLEPGEVRENVIIPLRVGGTITGQYLQGDGEPLEAALIQVQRTGGRDQHIARTDAEGAFSVDRLEPGTWQVIGVAGDIDSSGDPSAILKNLEMDMVDVADGEVVHVVLGAAPKSPVLLTGQVTPGEEAAGGLAILIPEGEGLLGAMKMGVIDDDGHFELTLDRPGTYVVTVQNTPDDGVGQDNVEFIERIPEGDRHHLDLELPQGAITGRVTDGAGHGIGGVRVSLYTDGGTSTGTMSGGKYTEARTEADGTFHLGHLTTGSYTVGAGGRPLTSAFDDEGVFGREVREHVKVTSGATARGIDFELEPAGTISGRILDAGGNPISDASIFVRDSRGVLLERISLQTSSSDGHFSYGGVAPGDYTISARASSQATPVETEIRVRSNEASECELVLGPATILRITCVDKEGEPMVAAIEVRDSEGKDHAGQFGMNDLTRMLSDSFSTTTRNVGPLPPGKYKIIATAGDKTVTKPVSLKGQESRKARVRIK